MRLNKIFRVLLSVAVCLVLISSLGVLAKNETVTITFQTGKDVTGARQAEVNEFEKANPNIKVKYLEMPADSNSQHNAAVTALSAEDSSVDVYTMDIIWPPEFGKAGWLLPLNKYFPAAERKQLLKGPVNGCTYEGKIYAIPYYSDAGLLFYRTDLVPKPPATWRELYDISKKLMDEKKVNYGFEFQAAQYEGLVCNALEYIWSNGGDVLRGKNVVINSPNSIEALNIFKDMLKIAPEGVTTYKENDSLVEFQQGRAAFLRNWPRSWASLNADNSAVKGKVGISPLPKGPHGKVGGTAALGGWNLGINKNSKNPAAAWKFVNYMTGAKNQAMNAILGGYLPTRMGVYQDPDVLKVNPHFKYMLDVYVNSRPRPVSPLYNQMSDAMQVAFHKCLTNELDAKTAIEQAEQVIKDVYKKTQN